MKNRILFLVIQVLLSSFAFAQSDSATTDQYWEEMIAAIRDNNFQRADSILENKFDVNTLHSSGLNLLAFTQVHGWGDGENYLKEKGANNSSMPSLESFADYTYRSFSEAGSTGMAVLVAHEGKILLQKGYGFADIEKHKPFTTQTPVRIASVTKNITAAAILKLVEQKKLTVDTPVATFFPDFPKGKQITVHQLLTHTSGLYNFEGAAAYEKLLTTQHDNQSLYNLIQEGGYQAAPNETWAYSNPGYLLLGMLIEKVSGMRYNAFIQKNLFAPLKITQTGIFEEQSLENKKAMGYEVDPNQKVTLAIEGNAAQAGAAGGLYSTVDDLYIWAKNLFEGNVLKSSSMKKMLKNYKVKSGEKTGYGYGWEIKNENGIESYFHDGDIFGYSSFVQYFPKSKTYLIYAANRSDNHKTERTQSLYKYLFWQQLPKFVTPKVATEYVGKNYEDYVGRYQIGAGSFRTATVFKFKKEGNKLMAKATASPDWFEFFPFEKDKFSTALGMYKISWVRDKSGVVVKGDIEGEGQKFKLFRLPRFQTVTLDTAVLSKFVGKYIIGGDFVEVELREKSLFLISADEANDFELFPTSELEFKVYDKVVDLRFEKDASGKIIKLFIKEAMSSELELNKM